MTLVQGQSEPSWRRI